MKSRASSAFAFTVAVVILVVGFTLAGIYGGRSIPELLQVSARGVVPPGFVAILGKQRSYTVWLEISEEDYLLEKGQERITFLPPSAEVKVVDLSSRHPIELSQSIPIRRKSAGEYTVSYGEFKSERDGQQIQLNAEGMAESVTMSVMPTNLGRVLRVSLGLIGITIATIVIALTSFVVLSRKHKSVPAAIE